VDRLKNIKNFLGDLSLLQWLLVGGVTVVIGALSLGLHPVGIVLLCLGTPQ